jgi:addiction module RelE/StbE family toxin
MSKVIIEYTARFLKSLKKLEKDLQEEVYEKIDLFEENENHEMLKFHKLNGKLKDKYSFSINYKYRVILYKNKNVFTFLDIGDHDLYK